MTNKVSFTDPVLPNIELEKIANKKDAFVRKKSAVFTRRSSQINLAQKSPISNTAEKANTLLEKTPLTTSTTTTSTSAHHINLSKSDEGSITDGIDQIAQKELNHTQATSNPHLEPFKELFGVKGEDGNIENMNEIKIIYQRMGEFAIHSGTTPENMVAQLKRGIEIAKEISSPEFKDSKKEYSANDLAAFDWFVRAQHAKMKKLYLKGATKIPDPDHRIAQFTLQVKGRHLGTEAKVAGPYPRASSHQPENREQIQSSTVDCPNGEKICFSPEVKNNLINSGVKEENIHLYSEIALGIDVSGKDENGNKLTPPGKESGTYLVMLMKDGDTSYVYLKAEGHSAAPIEGKYGDKDELAIAKLKHGMQLYKKFVPVNEGGTFPDLKEDKLPSNILLHLKDVKLLSGEKYSPLRESYENLQKTTQLKNNYALPQLKKHLENQLNHLELENQVNNLKKNELPLSSKLYKEMDENIKTVQRDIDKINVVLDDIHQVHEDSKIKTEFPLIPRSREVILPSLHEMLRNETPYVE